MISRRTLLAASAGVALLGTSLGRIPERLLAPGVRVIGVGSSGLNMLRAIEPVLGGRADLVGLTTRSDAYCPPPPWALG